MKSVAFTVIVLIAQQLSLARHISTFSALSCAFGKYKPLKKFYASEINPLVENLNEKVTFTLHTKKNPTGENITVGDSIGLLNTSFNSSNPTRIIIHGYFSSSIKASCVKPRDAFLAVGDFNVIVIDWWKVQHYGDDTPYDYFNVANSVKDVGRLVASMIDFLESHGMNLETTTLIGHSLGAHIMGIAGNLANNTVNYIVGLDPALPGFENKKLEDKLSEDDAKRVEVIHTNIKHCGVLEPIGHYDFYPNGGYRQPGCGNNTCSHSRAPELYAESITSVDGFLARKCPDFDSIESATCSGEIAKMGGIDKDKSTPQGIYYLTTGDSPPFALGRLALRMR